MLPPAPRYLEPSVQEDLASGKMVLLAGPRQVGKTTLAQRVLATFPSGLGLYRNWDRRADRPEIRAARWPPGTNEAPALVVLDEIHKWRGWKGWLKGEFDTHRANTRFLVAGSARMDVYRKGGDSLQGRYHHYRLHPFSLAEAAGSGFSLPKPGEELAIGDGASNGPESLSALLEFGGFPEPFLLQDARAHRRWQRARRDRVLQEDVRDLGSVREVSSIELLATEIARRVGSPLSLNALREDLEAGHDVVSRWVGILESLYYLVRIPPFTARSIRGLKKMPKAYLWDWSEVEDRAARLENLVALHLLKLCHAFEDRDGERVALHYLRDREGREVDFLVTHGNRPWFAVEVKTQATRIDPALRYFQERLKIPFVYQAVLETERDFVEGGVRSLPVGRLLGALV